MQYSYKEVLLTQIELGDTTFRISTEDVSPALIQSIGDLGLINPPTLLPTRDHFKVICGFARVQACLTNGWKSLPARIVPQETPRQRCAQQAIIDNSFHRPLNVVEQSHAVRLLKEVSEDVTQLVTMARQAGLSLNPAMVQKLEAVGGMPDVLRKGLVEGNIALPVALMIQDQFETSVVLSLSQFFNALQLSLNRQRTLLEWLVAITQRDQIGMEQLLAEKPIQNVLKDDQTDRPQQVKRIWEYIQSRRLPLSVSMHNSYNTLVKELHLKEGVRITAPTNFEGQTYTLHLQFQSLQQLKALEKEIQRLVRSPHMEDILNLIYRVIPQSQGQP